MSDPIKDLIAYMEHATSWNHYVVLVLAFLLVLAASSGTVAILRHAAREKKTAILLGVLALLSLGIYTWSDKRIGAIALAALILYALRRPIAGLFQRNRKRRARRNME